MVTAEERRTFCATMDADMKRLNDMCASCDKRVAMAMIEHSVMPQEEIDWVMKNLVDHCKKECSRWATNSDNVFRGGKYDKDE